MIRDALERALYTLNRLNSNPVVGSDFNLGLDHGLDKREVVVDWRGATARVQLGDSVHLRFRFDFGNGMYFTGDSSMAFNLADDGSAVASVQPVDSRGFPAQVESVVWSSSDASVISVVQRASDPLMADVGAVGAPGTSAQVQVSADADLGSGVVPLSGFADIAIVSGQAVSLTISLSSPTT